MRSDCERELFVRRRFEKYGGNSISIFIEAVIGNPIRRGTLHYEEISPVAYYSSSGGGHWTVAVADHLMARVKSNLFFRFQCYLIFFLNEISLTMFTE